MHEYTSTVRIWELSCPGYLEEIGRARRWTRDVLSDSDHADDAALIVTELGTNALLHSASGNQGDGFNLTISRTPQAVSVSVTDSGGTRTTPHVEHPDENDTHGRGLALVATLARRLHVYGDDEHGHTVTAELNAAPSRHPTSLSPGATGANARSTAATSAHSMPPARNRRSVGSASAS